MAVIYADTRGYLDRIPTSSVSRFEEELLRRLKSQHQDILDAIRTKKIMNEELEGQLRAALESFAETFA